MKTDIDRAEEWLARGMALPEDAPNRAAIINMWRSELRLLRVNMAEDRKANKRVGRYMRARSRKENAA